MITVPPVVRDLARRFVAHEVTLRAAGVAFFAFLAVVPACVAVVSLFGLWTNPASIASRANELLAAAPPEVSAFVSQQLSDLARSSSGELTVSAVIALVVALWSASSAVANAVRAAARAYDCEPTWVRRRAIALVYTLGAIVTTAVMLSLVGFGPVLLDALGLTRGTTREVLLVLRWPILVVVAALAFGVLYRISGGTKRWFPRGAVIAALVFFPVSLGFSFFTEHFSRYNATYGSLAGIVVLLLWLWLGAIVLLGGAELDAALEQAS